MLPALGTYVLEPLSAAVFNLLVLRLASPRVKRWLMGQGSTEDELVKLERLISTVKRVINDAEERQENDPDVKIWLNQVKHAIYDTEDLIDEIDTSDLEILAGTNQWQFSDVIDSFNPFIESVGSKIKKLTEKFKDFSLQIDALKLRDTHVQFQNQVSSETSDVVDVSRVFYGRSMEQETIVRILEDDAQGIFQHDKGKKSGGNNIIRVFVIVGMPGVGKTTLAQLIFNDSRVQDIFMDLKTWVHVPKFFESIPIMEQILSQLPHSSAQFPSQNSLVLTQRRIREKVVGKKILIVLDDVWAEDLSVVREWKQLLDSLISAGTGSTIIVTTRSENVQEKLCGAIENEMAVERFHVTTIMLHPLDDEDCWKLLKAHAFQDQEAAQDENLEAIGREVAQRCKGLPLAAKALGCYLRTISNNFEEWEKIANSQLWNVTTITKEIFPALLLSYYYLSPHLKRCFAYCSIFPKNYNFDKDKLILLWMAVGYIEQEVDDNRKMEDIGNIYFNDLKARSFFQKAYSNNQYFVMHDIFHDLAVYIMSDLSFMLEPNVSDAARERSRHLSFVQGKYDSLERFRPSLAFFGRLRTFLPITTSSKPKSYLTGDLLESFENFRCLRVLSFCGYRIISLPKSVCHLKHLRFLDLSFTLISELPEFIGGFVLLQTLLLSNCCNLKKLPTTITNLCLLRHLDIDGTKIEHMPEGMGRLKDLQTLTNYVVGEDCGVRIRELGDLSQLRGTLRISGIENIVIDTDASAARLSEKPFEELILAGNICDRDQLKNSILEALKPHTKLRRLTISNFKVERLPSWVGDDSFFNLEFLSLSDCTFSTSPALGHLPSLKHLDFNRNWNLKILGLEFYGQHTASSSPFKSLVTLKIHFLMKLKKWVMYDGDVMPFPRLEQLELSLCPDLEVDFQILELPSLMVLKIEGCKNLIGSLPSTPNLRTLELSDYGRIHMSSLPSLNNITTLKLSFENVESNLDAEALDVFQHLRALEVLDINSRTYGKTSLLWNLPSSVVSVSINGCLVDDIARIVTGCRHLRYFSITPFNSILQFPAGLSESLNHLTIYGCSRLVDSNIIPDGDEFGLANLYDLNIYRCSPLNIYTAARHLTTLSFISCQNVRFLPANMAQRFPFLKFLSFSRCPLSNSFPEENFPPQLETLQLHECSELESLSQYLYNCKSLKLLQIISCKNLMSLPSNCLPSTLHKLEIEECNKTTSFFEGGLPPSLSFLYLHNNGGIPIENFSDWKLDRLTSLQELHIKAPMLVEESFPADDSLPTSLIVLHISGIKVLKSRELQCVIIPDLLIFPESSINCRELQRITSLRDLLISSEEYSFSLVNLRQSLSHVIIGDDPESECKVYCAYCHKSPFDNIARWFGIHS